MLVVPWPRKYSSLYAETHLPPLAPVKWPRKNTGEGGGKGDGMESGQMQTRAGLESVFRRIFQPSGDALPGGCCSWKVPAEINDGRDGAQRLTDVRGLAVMAMGEHIHSFLFLLGSLLVFSSGFHLFDLSIFIYISAGMTKMWGVLCHIAGSPGDGWGIRSCQTPIRVYRVWINNHNDNTGTTVPNITLGQQVPT
jgi:hypothetical protein